MKRYEIQVVRVVREYQLVRVDAETESEARRKALKYARDNTDDFCDSSYGKPRIRMIKEIGNDL